MKTRIWTLAGTLLLFGTNCFGAAPLTTGAAVTLENDSANHPIYYQTLGNPAAGPGFYVQILGGPDSNSLQPIARLAETQSIFTIGTGDNPPGFFGVSVGIVPGVIERATASFQVLAWTGAASFETASQRVASGIFTQETGSSDPPSPPAPTLLQFPANLVIPAVPEPSVWVLCLVGLAGLYAGRWRR